MVRVTEAPFGKQFSDGRGEKLKKGISVFAVRRHKSFIFLFFSKKKVFF